MADYNKYNSCIRWWTVHIYQTTQRYVSEYKIFAGQSG